MHRRAAERSGSAKPREAPRSASERIRGEVGVSSFLRVWACRRPELVELASWRNVSCSPRVHHPRVPGGKRIASPPVTSLFVILLVLAAGAALVAQFVWWYSGRPERGRVPPPLIYPIHPRF